MIARFALGLAALPALSLGALPAAAQERDPAAAFTLTALTDTAAQIESGGIPYLCEVDRTETAIALRACLPVLSGPQADRLQAAVDEAARLTEALATAEAALTEAETARAALETQVATLEAAAATTEELQAEIAALEAALAPYLAADAEASANIALLEQAKTLQRAGGDLGRTTDTDLTALTRNALQAFFGGFGDPCGLSLADFQSVDEDEMKREILGHIFGEMGMSAEIASLIISIGYDAPNDTESPYNQYYTAVTESSDDAVYTQGRQARMIARDNLKEFEQRIETTVTLNPAHLALAADGSKVTLLNCP